MPGPRVGDTIADLSFFRPDGSAVLLSDYSGPLLLIFLRHLR